MPAQIVTHEQLVRVWQKCNSVKEVAEKTGLTEGTCQQRACYLRKKGVPLKRFHRGGVDFAALARLAKQLMIGEPEEPKQANGVADGQSVAGVVGVGLDHASIWQCIKRMRKQKMTTADMARELKLSLATVEKVSEKGDRGFFGK